MRLRSGIIATAMLTGAALVAGPAMGEPAEVRLARQFTLAELPLMIVEHERLIEKQGAILGLGEVKVTWLTPAPAPGAPSTKPPGKSPDRYPGDTGGIDALFEGRADLAVAGIGYFLVARDRKIGSADGIKALAALERIPYMLVTRNPAIRTIRDFTDKNRIALPGLRLSVPALMLEMAAAQEWGIENFDKLDGFAVTRTDADAEAALNSGKSDIDAHFTRSPYAEAELANPNNHRVMDSFDIGGPHSGHVLVAMTRFCQPNPVLCASVFAAVQDADAFIKTNPGAAAEIYMGMARDQDIPVEDFSDMVGDPDVAYNPAPAGIMRLAEFMHRIRRIGHLPESWNEMFFPDAHALAGS